MRSSAPAIIAIDYDAPSRELLKAVQRADALTGVRATANLQAATAAGIETGGANAGTDGLIGIGMATGTVGIHALEQPATADPADDHFATLTGFKRMLDAGLPKPRHSACEAPPAISKGRAAPHRGPTAVRSSCSDPAALSGLGATVAGVDREASQGVVRVSENPIAAGLASLLERRDRPR